MANGILHRWCHLYYYFSKYVTLLQRVRCTVIKLPILFNNVNNNVRYHTSSIWTALRPLTDCTLHTQDCNRQLRCSSYKSTLTLIHFCVIKLLLYLALHWTNRKCMLFCLFISTNIVWLCFHPRSYYTSKQDRPFRANTSRNNVNFENTTFRTSFIYKHKLCHTQFSLNMICLYY